MKYYINTLRRGVLNFFFFRLANLGMVPVLLRLSVLPNLYFLQVHKVIIISKVTYKPIGLGVKTV